jgi:hypothetical protein
MGELWVDVTDVVDFSDADIEKELPGAKHTAFEAAW